ncbi:MAG: hypothetical protein ACR2PL_02475 [Dehalococcoidia bacterium]
MIIYEERRVVLRRGALPEYQRLMLEEIWPALTGLGARPLCLLSGLIGVPATETYSFTGYRDATEWGQLQLLPEGPAPSGLESSAWTSLQLTLEKRAALVEEERVRLLRPSGVRPVIETPVQDRRAVYGMRRFFIHPGDWPAFERNSSEGVWLRIEAQDARILGLFHDAARTEPLEVTLLTGYHGPAHWEATRVTSAQPQQMSEELWELGRRAGAARNAITLRSFVYLMNAHWPAVAPLA